MLNTWIKNNYFLFTISFINGLIYPFAFAPFKISVIVFLHIIILIYCFKNSYSLKQIILVSFFTSLGLCLTGLYWIIYAIMYVFPNYFIASTLFFGFIVLYSVNFLILGIIFYLLPKKYINKLFYILCFVSLVVMDSFKNIYFGGFPWFNFALVWNVNIAIAQINYLGGAELGSILTITIALMFYYLISNFTKKRFLLVASLCFIFLFLSYLYGVLRLENFEEYTSNNSSIKTVQLVPQEIPQDNKFNRLYLNEIKQKLMQELNINEADYIIMPEVALPYVVKSQDDLAFLQEKISANSVLIIGALTKRNYNYYNSALLSSQDNFLSYNKRYLVPFGEYIPILQFIPFLTGLTGLEGLKSSKNSNLVFIDSDKILMNICFEALLNKSYKLSQASDFAINISNEAWFNRSIELDQYNDILLLRTIEHSITNIKISNRGKSLIINPVGGILYIDNIDGLQEVNITKTTDFSLSVFIKIFAYMLNIFYYISLMLLVVVKRRYY